MASELLEVHVRVKSEDTGKETVARESYTVEASLGLLELLALVAPWTAEHSVSDVATICYADSAETAGGRREFDLRDCVGAAAAGGWPFVVFVTRAHKPPTNHHHHHHHNARGTRLISAVEFCAHAAQSAPLPTLDAAAAERNRTQLHSQQRGSAAAAAPAVYYPAAAARGPPPLDPPPPPPSHHHAHLGHHTVVMEPRHPISPPSPRHADPLDDSMAVDSEAMDDSEEAGLVG